MDLKNITTQKDMEELLTLTNFVESDSFEELEIIEDLDYQGNEEQYPCIPECCYMGSITPQDFENSDYDALFIQTLVQMFKKGKLTVK